MAEEETLFNPLEGEVHEPAGTPGIKQAGAAMETHEATFADTNLIDLDLDHYVDDFNRRVIGAYQEGKGSAVLPADLGVCAQLDSAGHRSAAGF